MLPNSINRGHGQDGRCKKKCKANTRTTLTTLDMTSVTAKEFTKLATMRIPEGATATRVEATSSRSPWTTATRTTAWGNAQYQDMISFLKTGRVVHGEWFKIDDVETSSRDHSPAQGALEGRNEKKHRGRGCSVEAVHERDERS